MVVLAQTVRTGIHTSSFEIDGDAVENVYNSPSLMTRGCYYVDNQLD